MKVLKIQVAKGQDNRFNIEESEQLDKTRVTVKSRSRFNIIRLSINDNPQKLDKGPSTKQ